VTINIKNAEKWMGYTQQFDASELRRTIRPDQHRIGRETRISGGVHGLLVAESLEVNVEKYAEYYDEYYHDAYNRADSAGSMTPRRILHAAFDTVAERMPYSQQRVDDILGQIARQDGREEIKPGRKVELATFMAAGYGVCRHQALALGATLERFQDEELIGGRLSIHRSQLTDAETGEKGGHQWLRWTPDNARPGDADAIIIMDVAGRYFGTLAESTKNSDWDYYLPGEEESTQEDWLTVARSVGVTAVKDSDQSQARRTVIDTRRRFRGGVASSVPSPR
jgi:hypothetical protein